MTGMDELLPRLNNALAAVALAVLLVFVPGTALALTEGDWMIALVDSLGKSYGLPDEPKPEDYLTILQGKRNLRFEAETVRADYDEVSVLPFLNYGPFSGPGWVLGTSKPTLLHLKFTLPLDGRYRLKLAVQKPGHTVQVDDRTVTADGAANLFTPIDLGEVQWTAGPHEVVVTIPPGGAVDYLDISAPNLPMIAPVAGWRKDEPLTWETLALTAVQAFQLTDKLPATETTVAVEAETLQKTGNARLTDEAHLGRPSGGKWLRTSAQPATFDIPVTVPAAGYYDIELTLLGDPVEIVVNDHLPVPVKGLPYLSPITTPPVFLATGANQLRITLPPGGGLDRVALKGRQTDLAALAAVLELTVAGAAPTGTDLDKLTVRLTATPR